MVVPGSEALDTTVCVLATWVCALDVGGGGKGCVFACLPFCHALFLGGFHWFSVACAPWLRRVCRGADGVVVFVCVFGVGFWRGIVGICLVVLECVLSHDVFGLGIWRVRVVFGGYLGQFSIFGRVCVGCAFLLVGILG
jgi:hypothetical protein